MRPVSNQVETGLFMCCVAVDGRRAGTLPMAMPNARPPKRPITVADVARAAGVSKATAARVLGGYGTVSSDLSARIRASAKDLDYRPNELARTMATGRSATIGVVVGDIENPFFGHLTRGITDRAKAFGCGVIVTNSGESAEEERAAVTMLLGKRVDGLIVAPANRARSGHLRDAIERGVPLVLVDRETEGLSVDAVVADDRKAARVAVGHLIAAGHRRIAYLTATEADAPTYHGPEQIKLTTVLRRIEGLVEEAAAAGIAEPERFIRLGAVDAASSRRILDDLFALPDRPTAILASDSKLALQVLQAARRANLSIPDNLSLVTFDDAEWTRAISPTVTVLAQPSYDMGAQAVRLLIERVEGRRDINRITLETVLIERESVAPPLL